MKRNWFRGYEELPLLSDRVVRLKGGQVVRRVIRLIDRRVFLSMYLSSVKDCDMGKRYIRDCDPESGRLIADYVQP
jgi:hypothetical protein